MYAKGVVNVISLVPSQGNYRVEIGLSQGLVTNYKIELPLLMNC